jgi:hypothetical protein
MASGSRALLDHLQLSRVGALEAAVEHYEQPAFVERLATAVRRGGQLSGADCDLGRHGYFPCDDVADR